MRNRHLSNILSGLAAMAIGGALILWITPAQTVPAIFASVPSGFYPNFTSGMLILSGFGLVLSGLATAAPDAEGPGAGHIALRFFAAFVLLGVAMALTPVLGFPIAGAAICLVTLVLMRETRWHLVALICICVPLIVWAGFEQVLGRPLP